MGSIKVKNKKIPISGQLQNLIES